jgi:phospholipase/carboxylesterase
MPGKQKTLRVRTSGEGPPGGPAIVLCHGFGAPGDDLVPLARAVDAGRGVRWFFPEAPLEIDFGMGMTGRAWWPIDIERVSEMMMRGQRDALSRETPPGLFEARALLERTIDRLIERHGVVRSKLVVGGFSQGAMVATELSLFAAEPFAGLVVLSGTLLCRDRWSEAARAAAPGISALITHGRADPLLPFEGAEALRDVLAGAGAAVEWVPHGGAHEIPGAALDAFGRFARARLQ